MSEFRPESAKGRCRVSRTTGIVPADYHWHRSRPTEIGCAEIGFFMKQVDKKQAPTEVVLFSPSFVIRSRQLPARAVRTIVVTCCEGLLMDCRPEAQRAECGDTWPCRSATHRLEAHATCRVPAVRHDRTDLAASPIEIRSAPCHLRRDDMVPNYTRQNAPNLTAGASKTIWVPGLWQIGKNKSSTAPAWRDCSTGRSARWTSTTWFCCSLQHHRTFLSS